MKKCPIHNTPLNEIFLQGIKVDRCPKDGGLWFDSDELRRVKDASDEDLAWLDFDLFEERDNKFTKYNTDKKCPNDSTEMISLKYMDSKVQIDKCIKCNGTWLEKGEFEKIISHLDKKINKMSSSDLDDHLIKRFVDTLGFDRDENNELKDFLALLKLYGVRLEAEHPTAEKWIRRILAYWPIR